MTTIRVCGYCDKISVRIEEKKGGKLNNEVLMTMHNNTLIAHMAQQAVQTAEQCGFEILQHPG